MRIRVSGQPAALMLKLHFENDSANPTIPECLRLLAIFKHPIMAIVIPFSSTSYFLSKWRSWKVSLGRAKDIGWVTKKQPAFRCWSAGCLRLLANLPGCYRFFAFFLGFCGFASASFLRSWTLHLSEQYLRLLARALGARKSLLQFSQKPATLSSSSHAR